MRGSTLSPAWALVIALGLSTAAAIGCAGASSGDASPPPALRSVGPSELRAPADFQAIADPAARSTAMFLEAARVMTHPRCSNCHPSGELPLQGDHGEPHDPPVVRGPDDHGIVGLECTSCHQDRNLELARVPGAPKWALAPRSMAWVGKTPHQICEQVKDPARNGGKSLAEIARHAHEDPLVAWGWAPGWGRSTPPGSQAEYGALISAWIESGAACPEEEVSR